MPFSKHEDGAEGNGCQPTGILAKRVDSGLSKGGTDCDGYKKANKLQWLGHTTRRDETENIRAIAEMKKVGEAPLRKTQVEMEGHCQKRQETYKKAYEVTEEWSLAQGDGCER